MNLVTFHLESGSTISLSMNEESTANLESFWLDVRNSAGIIDSAVIVEGEREDDSPRAIGDFIIGRQAKPVKAIRLPIDLAEVAAIEIEANEDECQQTETQHPVGQDVDSQHQSSKQSLAR